MEVAKSGLQASLLVRHPETKELYVNFDPQILTLIRESECMVRLGLDIPFGAQTLLQKRQAIKRNYNRLQVVNEKKNVTFESHSLVLQSTNSFKQLLPLEHEK